MNILDELDDETELSQGQEIGKALSSAIEGINKSNQDMATMLTIAIKDAMQAVESKQITISKSDDKPITEWTFKVEYKKRDGIDRPDTITATAR